ncbi:hypothetical protein QWY86_05480 [Pedobacter aquatilis]|uniref:hypothetical protein n=1 Tax=Pedobacter aquatilis TaxID=351343 RepID=UPI0025B596B9|nr:hypothetical protein [Pedobacter aquatilis]MDN3586108.1 hypothetical protein [Pedobacter aquatilis]
MKVTVCKYLNARKSAQIAAECPLYRKPGDTLEISHVLTGTMIEGNAIWYRCSEDGNFYWSGGIMQTVELLQPAIPVSSFTQEQQLDIYITAANELSADFAARGGKGFKGLAVGYKSLNEIFTDELSLVFYVSEKDDNTMWPIPEKINHRGIALTTDVRKMRDIILHEATDAIEADEGPNYTMGGSLSEMIGGVAQGFGSRASLVTRRDKYGEQLLLLACFHVACNALFKSGIFTLDNQNRKVSFPSPLRTKQEVSSLLSGTVVEGGYGPGYDYALIDIGQAKLSNRLPDKVNFAGYYTMQELKTKFNKDKVLRKYGAKTLDSVGTFRTLHTTGRDLGKGIVMSGLIETSCMSDKGDSGAPVIDPENNFLVGYIIAGITKGKEIERCSFILPFAALEFKFSIKPHT